MSTTVIHFYCWKFIKVERSVQSVLMNQEQSVTTKSEKHMSVKYTIKHTKFSPNENKMIEAKLLLLLLLLSESVSLKHLAFTALCTSLLPIYLTDREL